MDEPRVLFLDVLQIEFRKVVFTLQDYYIKPKEKCEPFIASSKRVSFLSLGM